MEGGLEEDVTPAADGVSTTGSVAGPDAGGHGDPKDDWNDSDSDGDAGAGIITDGDDDDDGGDDGGAS